MRHICYVTGTRADFGLMSEALTAIQIDPRLCLSVCITGMHLLPEYGETWKEIEKAGFSIKAKVPVSLSGSSGADMAKALGEQIVSFTQIFSDINPDLVLVLGDRGEMLAGAIAAIHLNIPIVHIHGGELSGTVDESVRHAISKLSHYHFTSTTASRERLVRMGENPDNVFVTGAPGLDAICQLKPREQLPLYVDYGLDMSLPLAIVLFHPVLQQAQVAGIQVKMVLDAVAQVCKQALVILPNADVGGSEISEAIDAFTDSAIRKVTHITRTDFLSMLHYAEVLVGNSSSGIIEAASIGIPVVNIGDRQNRRERNLNVIDVPVSTDEILKGITTAQNSEKFTGNNIYGDGSTAERIVDLLATLPLSRRLLEKVNAY